MANKHTLKIALSLINVGLVALKYEHYTYVYFSYKCTGFVAKMLEMATFLTLDSNSLLFQFPAVQSAFKRFRKMLSENIVCKCILTVTCIIPFMPEERKLVS